MAAPTAAPTAAPATTPALCPLLTEPSPGAALAVAAAALEALLTTPPLTLDVVGDVDAAVSRDDADAAEDAEDNEPGFGGPALDAVSPGGCAGGTGDVRLPEPGPRSGGISDGDAMTPGTVSLKEQVHANVVCAKTESSTRN